MDTGVNNDLLIAGQTNKAAGTELGGASSWLERSDTTTTSATGDDPKLADFVAALERHGIKVCDTHGQAVPPEGRMHDKAATVPRLVVSPLNEWEVRKILELLTLQKLYDQCAVSVKSGGHGYFNGASCSGVMINVGNMVRTRIEHDVMVVEPGCVLGQLIDALWKNGKAVPHGDCFGVGAGGHFLTAGWDIALARRYGLGCQSVVGGRVALWNGEVVGVDENSHPDLLYAMRGGAVAKVGVVTEIRLRLLDQPALVSWCFRSLSSVELEKLVSQQAFACASTLPNEVSVSFRFHFHPDQPEPV